MERIICTLVREADWRAAEALGEYRGSADDARDGFLHFSTRAQLRATAAKHRAGIADLWLVEADVTALDDALRWEPASGSSRPGLFPHLYAPLPVSAVVRAVAVALVEGVHVFPDDVP